MTEKNFSTAKWIWHPGDASPRNTMVLMRTEFDFSDSGAVKVWLSICADSRYVVSLNGHRIGQGPARSWPHHRLFDRYDITGILKTGRNVISVSVLSWGESNFQYLHNGKAGLICEIATDKGNVLLDSNASWKSAVNPAYDMRSRRASIQLDFAEIYSASKAFENWQSIGFDDSAWETAREVGSPDDAAWGRLEKKRIKDFSSEPCYPKGIAVQRIVSPFGGFVNFWQRWFFTPGDTSQNQFPMEGIAASTLRLDNSFSATLRNYYTGNDLYVNGNKVEFDASGYFPEAKVDFNQGDNLVVVRLRQSQADYFGFGFRFDTKDVDAQWSSPDGDPNNETAWLISDGSERGKLKLEPMLIEFDSYTSPYAETIDKAMVSETAAEMLSILPRTESFPLMTSVDQCAMYDTVEPVVISSEVNIPTAGNLVGKQDACAVIEPSTTGDVELVLDMGRIRVGEFSLEIDAPVGAVIDINAAEELYDGKPFYPRNVENTVRYIAKEGRQFFRSFTRHGGRWVSLTLRNFSRPVEIHDFHVELMTYPQAGKGMFECSDPKLNDIWKMCAYTLRLCSEDTYTDCPTYERAAWVGDIRNEALIHYAVNGDATLSKHCLLLAGQSLEYSKMVQLMAVSGWNCILPAWSFLWGLSCWEVYVHDGDRKFLNGIYPEIKENLEGAISCLNKDGLFEIKAWNFMDWTPTTQQFYGIATFQQGWCVAALSAGARVAKTLGYEKDAEYFESVARRIKDSANKFLWNEEEQAYADGIGSDGKLSQNISQQTMVVMYLCDMADVKRKEQMRPFLTEPKSDWDRNGTPFMEGFLLECLERENCGAEVISVIRKRWGAMIDTGLSTCLEMFPDPNKSRSGRSHCHAWSATPGYFLPRIILGARSLEPGFKKVLIAPKVEDLEWAKGSVPTPHGVIEIDWERTSEEFCLKIKVSERIEAEVILPKEVCHEEEPSVESHSGHRTEQLMDGTWRINFETGASAKITIQQL